jgi:hypothetical protein
LVSALTNTEPTTAASSSWHAISLLLQDLFDIRVDKLRQQFIHLLSNEERNVDFDLTVDVSDIGNQELALLRGFVTQAVTDHYWMASSSSSTSTSTGKKPSSEPTTTTIPEHSSPQHQDQNAVVMEESSASAFPQQESSSTHSTTATYLPPRLQIRRFRS